MQLHNFIHEMYVRRDHHAGFGTVVYTVQQVIQDQCPRYSKGRHFRGINCANAEIIAFPITGTGETVT